MAREYDIQEAVDRRHILEIALAKNWIEIEFLKAIHLPSLRTNHALWESTFTDTPSHEIAARFLPTLMKLQTTIKKCEDCLKELYNAQVELQAAIDLETVICGDGPRLTEMTPFRILNFESILGMSNRIQVRMYNEYKDAEDVKFPVEDVSDQELKEIMFGLPGQGDAAK